MLLVWLLMLPRCLSASAERLATYPGKAFRQMRARSRISVVKLTFENLAISVFTSRLLVREQGASGQVALHRSNMQKIAYQFRACSVGTAWWERRVSRRSVD